MADEALSNEQGRPPTAVCYVAHYSPYSLGLIAALLIATLGVLLFAAFVESAFARLAVLPGAPLLIALAAALLRGGSVNVNATGVVRKSPIRSLRIGFSDFQRVNLKRSIAGRLLGFGTVELLATAFDDEPEEARWLSCLTLSDVGDPEALVLAITAAAADAGIVIEATGGDGVA